MVKSAHCDCPASEVYFWDVIWVTALFLIERPNQQQVLLILTYEAWLTKPCVCCINLSFLDSSLLQPDKLPQLSKLVLYNRITKKMQEGLKKSRIKSILLGEEWSNGRRINPY